MTDVRFCGPVLENSILQTIFQFAGEFDFIEAANASSSKHRRESMSSNDSLKAADTKASTNQRRKSTSYVSLEQPKKSLAIENIVWPSLLSAASLIVYYGAWSMMSQTPKVPEKSVQETRQVLEDRPVEQENVPTEQKNLPANPANLPADPAEPENLPLTQANDSASSDNSTEQNDDSQEKPPKQERGDPPPNGEEVQPLDWASVESDFPDFWNPMKIGLNDQHMLNLTKAAKAAQEGPSGSRVNLEKVSQEEVLKYWSPEIVWSSPEGKSYTESIITSNSQLEMRKSAVWFGLKTGGIRWVDQKPPKFSLSDSCAVVCALDKNGNLSLPFEFNAEEKKAMFPKWVEKHSKKLLETVEEWKADHKDFQDSVHLLKVNDEKDVFVILVRIDEETNDKDYEARLEKVYLAMSNLPSHVDCVSFPFGISENDTWRAGSMKLARHLRSFGSCFRASCANHILCRQSKHLSFLNDKDATWRYRGEQDWFAEKEFAEQKFA